MEFVRTAAALLFIIALPTALITTNIRIAVNEPRVYEYSIDQYDAVETTGIERSELLRASRELRTYFNRGGDEPVFVRVQREGEPLSLFNQRETAHLVDVKNAFQTMFLVQEASLVFILAYVVGVFIWAREGSLRSLATQVLIAGLLSLIAVGALGAVALAGFDQAWEQFHEVLFSNDLWRLNPERDRLIQMFPQAFWRDISLWIGIGTLIQLGVLSGIAGAYLAFTRRQPDGYRYPAGAQPLAN